MSRHHDVVLWVDESPPHAPPGLEAVTVHIECADSDTVLMLTNPSALGEAARSFLDIDQPATQSLLVAEHEARCALGLATSIRVGGRTRHKVKADHS